MVNRLQNERDEFTTENQISQKILKNGFRKQRKGDKNQDNSRVKEEDKRFQNVTIEQYTKLTGKE